jgi:uncharacterized protein with von Willebrand factor type A (vWA) domain
MPEFADAAPGAPENLPERPGHLADNVVHFARVLRAAGIPVGTDRVLLTLRALHVAGIESRTDFYSVLLACLTDRAEQRPLFDQAFHIFWRDPDLLGQMLRLLLPQVKSKATSAPPENRRLSAAMLPPPAQPVADRREENRIEISADLSWSDREQLRKADFDSMSAAEWQAAKQVIARLQPFFAQLTSRRYRPSHRGARIDLRAALRDSARRGGDIAELPRRVRRTRPAPLVVIVDISGSMSRYSRMFLHFVHTIANADLRVHAFVFGTRLSHITRQLRARDPDLAVASVVGAVDDWSGGTRIAHALHEFNGRWARRVLSGSPTVLLVTDGLEHADLESLEHEAERLSKSCRRLVWLNPLLRYEQFEPRARGVRAILPFVDAFLPVHNVDSLLQLAETLAQAADNARVARRDVSGAYRSTTRPEPAHVGSAR